MIGHQEAIEKNVTDEQLIRQFQDGDTDAYTELVSRYKKPLYNFIYRIVNDAIYAEDLLQETFLRLWLKHASYKEVARFSTWIYTIAGNLAKTELRRRRIRRWISLSGDNDVKPVEFPDKSADPYKDMVRRNIKARIETEISRLPSVFREVVILRDMRELCYEEISSILDIPIGTVKSRVNRGRKRLQKKLKDLR